jgi:hypothetical protein
MVCKSEIWQEGLYTPRSLVQIARAQGRFEHSRIAQSQLQGA